MNRLAGNAAARFQRVAYQEEMVACDCTRILMLYVGGTIGMLQHAELGYYPVGGMLAHELRQLPPFYDAAATAGHQSDSIGDEQGSLSPWLVTPPSIYGKRIAYRIKESSPLLDSSNMSMNDWLAIAADIERHYQAYDAFIILHGTDTMAYTASALAFLLEGLGKTVILTGSQIPLSEQRNDAAGNLLGAMTIAGHYVIPEVTLYFNQRLLRGCRASKNDALSFDAFWSPNLKPLATVGIRVEVAWPEVWRGPEQLHALRVHRAMNPQVAVLRLFPGITETCVRAVLAAPTQGVILETFGAGNAPDNRPDLHAALREAIQERGVVIVNCTQCARGTVSDLYATGRALTNLGVTPGTDMTTEAALTKLSYLLSQPLTPTQVRHLMQTNLRGELTVPIVTHSANNQVNKVKTMEPSPAAILSTAILATQPAQREAVERLLRPLLMHAAARQGDLSALESLAPGMHIDAIEGGEEGRTALMLAVEGGHLPVVNWLLEHGANVHLRARTPSPHGLTALGLAFERAMGGDEDETNLAIIRRLIETGARLSDAPYWWTRLLKNEASPKLFQLAHEAGLPIPADENLVSERADLLAWLETTHSSSAL